MHNHAALRMLAARIKEKVGVAEAAGWFGFDYGAGDYHERYPCPVCVEVSTSKKTLQVRNDGRTWVCYHCDAGGDVIDWIASRLDLTKGRAIATLASRIGLSADPASVLEYLRSELSSNKRLDLAHESLHASTVRAVRAAYWLWRSRHPDADPRMVARAVCMFETLEQMSENGRPDAVEHATRIAGEGPIVPKPRTTPHLAALARLARAYHDACRYGSPGHSYLLSRGVSTDSMRHNALGWCDGSAPCALDRLDQDLLAEVGALHRNPSAGRSAHAMADRAVFPILNGAGQVLGFGGRSLGTLQPKYLNSRDSGVFDKSRALYGVHRAAEAIVSARTAVVVEGYMDVVALHQRGVRHAVATMGTALNRRQADYLGRLASRIVLVYDPDSAGERGAARAALVAASGRYDVFRAVLPPGVDPDQYVHAHGPQGFLRLIAGAEPVAVRRENPNLDRVRELLAKPRR